MFYFRKKAFFTTEIKEWKQFSNVLKFRKQLTSFGVLFWDYEEPIDFERRFREHLTNQILQLQKATPFISVSRSPLLFVSYKREDILRVEPIYDALRAAGFTPWMDVRDILPGGQWVEEVEKAITSADFFLTFVSVNTVDPTVRSETGFSIPAEVAIARKKFDQEEATTPELRPSPRSHFIPVRLDPVMPPASISQFQWIDFFNPDGQRELIDAVRRIWNQRRCV
jgi:hypothetical protein